MDTHRNTQYRKRKISSEVSVRELWNTYRAEVGFFACLSIAVVISHRLSWLIPVEFFDEVLTPIQNSFTITVCLFGACLLFLHSDGYRTRRVWAWTLTAWGVLDMLFLLQTCVMGIPVLTIGNEALNAYELLAGNFLGWLMLFYPTEALRPGWLTLRRAVLQLLPVVLLVALDYVLPVNLAPLIACYPAVLALLLASHIRAYRIWCEENYSSMDHIDVQWIVRYMIMLLVVGASFLYLCFTHNPARAFTQQWLLFFLFAYSTEQILFRKNPWAEENTNDQQPMPTVNSQPPTVNSQQPTTNANDQQPMPTANDQQPTANANADLDAYAEALKQWMENAKPYLNPDFKLADLREVLPMNRSYLSQFINDTYGCTFYQFVNNYRIAEAQRLMSENPELKMTEIASRSGFTSRSSFTQTFTREVGVSPREWSKKCYNT